MIAAGSAVIPLLTVIVYDRPLWPAMLFAAWIGAIAWYSVRTVRKEYEELMKRSLLAAHVTAIHTLNHHRHDWMNELQIVYGYIQLKKHDQLLQSVGKIKERMAQESKISKLGIPSLVLYFHSFRTCNADMQLDVRLDEEIDLTDLRMAIDAETLSQTIQDTVRIFQYIPRQTYDDERVLQVMFQKRPGELRVAYRWEGEVPLDALDDVRQKMNSIVQGKPGIMEQPDSGRASFEWSVPCVT